MKGEEAGGGRGNQRIARSLGKTGYGHRGHGKTGKITYTNVGMVMNLRLSVLALSYGKDGKADTASGTKDDVFSLDLK
jgi:hypothetical protein